MSTLQNSIDSAARWQELVAYAKKLYKMDELTFGSDTYICKCCNKIHCDSSIIVKGKINE